MDTKKIHKSHIIQAFRMPETKIVDPTQCNVNTKALEEKSSKADERDHRPRSLMTSCSGQSQYSQVCSVAVVVSCVCLNAHENVYIHDDSTIWSLSDRHRHGIR
jgi:hypothetical protein